MCFFNCLFYFILEVTHKLCVTLNPSDTDFSLSCHTVSRWTEKWTRDKKKACNSWQYELKGQRSRTSEIRADSERTCCTATVSAECNPNRRWGLSMRAQAASKTPAAFLLHYSVLFLHLDVRKNTLTCSSARLCLPDWEALRRKQ